MPSVFAQSQPAPAEADVREALTKFIRAFDDLDWEHFRLAFDDNATVFYPRAMPQRANGRAEFEKAFKTVFQEIRDGKTTAPYMDIQAKEIENTVLRRRGRLRPFISTIGRVPQSTNYRPEQNG
jgi:hypothetical protein